MARPPRRRLRDLDALARAQQAQTPGAVPGEGPLTTAARVAQQQGGLGAPSVSDAAGVVTESGAASPMGVAATLSGQGPPPEEPATPSPPAPTEPHPVAGAEGMEPEFARRLDALIAASGGRIRINSGYRSEAEQAALYQEALAKYGSPQAAGKWVAPPGKSNHGRGIAADLGGDMNLAHQLAPQFGLVFPMGHEPWHIEPVGLRQDASTPPEAYTAPGVKEAPPIQDDKGIPVEHMAAVADMVLSDAVAPVNFARHLGEQQVVETPEGTAQPLEGTGPPPPPEPEEPAAAAATQAQGGGESGEGGDAESWIREAMRITGVDESWYPGLKARMMQESGGRNIPQGITDVNTAKGTPAFGPMQVIQPTFNSHKLAGYENWKDPLHNTIAAIRYITARYGHPSKLPRGGY